MSLFQERCIFTSKYFEEYFSKPDIWNLWTVLFVESECTLVGCKRSSWKAGGALPSALVLRMPKPIDAQPVVTYCYVQCTADYKGRLFVSMIFQTAAWRILTVSTELPNAYFRMNKTLLDDVYKSLCAHCWWVMENSVFLWLLTMCVISMGY